MIDQPGAEDRVERFLRGMPKAELHVHIEGTLEPEMMFVLAEKHGLRLPHADVDALRAAYRFGSLQDFLELYYQGAAVLRDEEDFRDLGLDYLRRAHEDGVRRVEMFFDPQTHTERGVPIGSVIEGLNAACHEAASSFGISAALIMCFLRHLPQDAAMSTFDRAAPFVDRIIGVGLDSSEMGHPPQKFVDVFARARAEGLHTVAHAGEEGPPEYIRDSLDHLGAERIDHGVRCLDDPNLVARLADERVPLTVCPLSNVRLSVVPDMSSHPLPQLLDAGLVVSINSDDPAYFGGYVGDNYVAVQHDLGLTKDAMVAIARASVESSFAAPSDKAAWLRELDEYAAAS